MRKSLASILREFSNQHDLKGGDRVPLKSILDMQKTIQSNAKDSRNKSIPYLQEIINDIDLCIVCLTGLCMSCLYFYLNEADENEANRILSSDFPANDVMLGTFLINIINIAIAINKLCVEGLDTQARVLVRTLDERLLQIPVLFASPDDYKIWHNATDENSKETHYTLFSKKSRLYKRYAEIEKICLEPTFDTDIMSKWRKENEEFYSMAVHGSASAILVGSWALAYESEHGVPNFLGTPSSASISTLKHTRFALFYFIWLFPEVLEKFHQWEPDKTNVPELLFKACHYGVLKTAQEWLETD